MSHSIQSKGIIMNMQSNSHRRQLKFAYSLSERLGLEFRRPAWARCE